jgi:hypothetical protein
MIWGSLRAEGQKGKESRNYGHVSLEKKPLSLSSPPFGLSDREPGHYVGAGGVQLRGGEPGAILAALAGEWSLAHGWPYLLCLAVGSG